MHVFEIFSSTFMLICSIFGVICAVIFISIVIIDRQCRSMTTLLVFNSTVAGFFINIVYTCQSLYQLITDQDDSLCAFRGFLLYSTCGLLYHTYCVQALYRLFATMSTHRQLYLRSKHSTLFVVIIQWLISITFSLPILLNDQIKYQTGSRICQASMTDIFGSLYLSAWIYIFPLSIIIGIYVRILLYIKKNSYPTVIRRNLFEQQRQLREFRIFRRITIPVIILFLMGFPYALFFLITQFSHQLPSPYAQRISFMFISFGQGTTMLLCLINTDDIRKYLMNSFRKIKRRRRPRRVPGISIIDRPVQVIPLQLH